jgi:PAS domain S-box-containing protein
MVSFSWEDFLKKHRDEIVLEWGIRLQHDVSVHYEKRSPKELAMTTRRAFDSFYQVLVHKNYALINEFINEITKIRLEAGFRLDDVQKAFEIYRRILIPILVRESPATLLCKNIEAVNTNLAYTIHRFSSHFQKMHDQYINEYAKQLEKDVAERTGELRKSEDKYKTLVEDISDGYLVLYGEKIVFVNPAFCRMHGYQAEEILQKSFLAFVSAQSHENVRAIIDREASKGIEPEAFEYLRLTKQGKSLPTEINFRPSWFGEQEYTLCIVRDITKRVEMEKKSRKIERMTYIGQLTASLSHEIRNPLSSVKMNLQILSKNIILNGNDRKRLEISKNEIDRLEGILEGLLNYAKPLSLKFGLININDIVCACIELLEIKFHRKSVDYKVVVDSSLRSFSGDKGKLEQIIINLLLNALDSVEDFGNIRIVTHQETKKGKPFAMIRIEDDGKGVPEKLLPHIFEPFYTTKTNGTGLGLANVKQIIKAHRGEIRVFNLKGKGSAFEVLLPLGEING